MFGVGWCLETYLCRFDSIPVMGINYLSADVLFCIVGHGIEFP